MHLKVDEHLLAVASFMQANVPQSKIQAVANALPRLAELLWEQDVLPGDRPLRLLSTSSPAPSDDHLHSRSDATG